MLVMLRRFLYRVIDIVFILLRGDEREELNFRDFHADWEGLKSLNEVLGDASGPLKAAVDELWRCIQIFESNQHKTRTQTREKYAKLGVEMNDLSRALSKFFDGTAITPITHEHVAQLARDIGNETSALINERPKVEQDAENETDVEEVLRCYRRVQTLLGRFALTKDTDLWKIPDENLLATRLDSLPYSPEAQYRFTASNDVRRTGCMPNTRTDLLQQLQDWVHYNGGQKVYWLNGMAGTGKTAIAYSFCEQLECAGRLAASFFCSWYLPACRDVKRVIPSISYQLSSISRPFLHTLSSVLEDTEVDNLPLSEQLTRLLAEPLSKVKHTFPANMVVVIDGLDECEDDVGVDQILEILLRCASNLPMKFFITSRPNSTILSQMQSKSVEHVVFELRLNEVDRSVVKKDIGTYLKAKLESANLPESGITFLTQRSKLSFTYASTIANYLGHDNFSQITTRLDYILGAPISSLNAPDWDMSALYANLLHKAFGDNALEPSKWEKMTLVLHTMICAQEPLTMKVLVGLLKLDGASSVYNALLPLQSVPQVLLDTSGLVPPMHESFANYMLDQQRSNRLYCDTKKHHTRLAQACFDLIDVPSPPFNICKLKSSFLRDWETPNIDQKVKEAIPPELLYACRYWGAHVELAEDSEDLLDRLYKFLATRLLLWMEILNVKQCIDAATSQLYRLCTWLKKIKGAAIIRDLAHDAWRFVLAFSSSPMRDSTPHIYASMLPFWPRQQPVSRHYMPGMISLVKATGEGMRMRECAPLAVLSSSSDSVTRLAYSPDGAYIAASSLDCTIRIWDARTGQLVGQPLKGHTESVCSVAYSPNGAYLVSGSKDKTIRIWNAHTRQPVGQPLEGHTDLVSSVEYSPNGENIASGSYDGTIRIWDAQTGQPIGQPLKGYTKYVFVTYSPNGAHIVAGSWNNTIRIWDVQAREPVGQPLEGHTDSVYSVAYSPTGARIISGSKDSTIRIWDAHTGHPIGQPLKGHTGSVCSVAYSPNGAYIVSGSSDKTIRIWNAHAGQPVGQPLEGHTNTVHSVAYSPDGAHVASGSSDNTTRIWDAHAGQSADQPLEGHTDSINSVAYSRSRACIVSCSSDCTIRVWDVRTRQPIGQPLKGHAGPVYAVTYSCNGAHIVSGSSDNTIRIWNARTGEPEGQPLVGHTDVVSSVVCSPKDARIVSGSWDTTIRIWYIHDGQLVSQPLDGHTRSVNSVAYSPNGAHIVSGSSDKTIRIWDAHTGQPVGQPLRGHTGPVSSVAYSRDGAYIVSGSDDKTIRIWDAHNRLPIDQPLQGHTGSVRSVAYSRNGAYIVSGSLDKTIRIWDAHTGQPIGRPFEGHTGPAYSVAYSPNGTHIVSGSWDRTIRIWDTRRGKVPGPPASASSVHSVMSPGFKDPLSQPTQYAAHTSGTTASQTMETEVHVPSGDWTLDQQGWVVNAEQHRLVWVPYDLHAVLLRPRNTAVLSRSGSVKLDLSNAKLGEQWGQCFDSKSLADVN
ncbi:hypothetical protein FRC08_002403 [Ceratobasidium sp. 394]|nr:hypothetical protein FRC08_002403 [Ceratobasidium sp. 394]